MNKKLALFLLMGLWAVNGALGQYGVHSFRSDVTKVGTVACPFLTVGVGARANAMGGAFASIADDATALFWNPAGVALLQKNELTVMHCDWIADLRHDYLGLALPMGIYGTLGVQLNALSMDELDVRTPDMPEGTGERAGAGDFSAGLSYARSLTDRLSIGASFKYVSSRLWHMSAQTGAVDLGVMLSNIFDRFQLGASITNVGGKMKYAGRDNFVYHDIRPSEAGNNDKIDAELQTQAFNLPTAFQVGVSTVINRSGQAPLLLAIEFYSPSDNVKSVNIGAEWSFYNHLFLRSGYNSLLQDDSEKGLAFGGGLNLSVPASPVQVVFDYSYEQFGVFDYTQRLSASFRF